MGDKGCKYLTKAHMPNLEQFLISIYITSKVTTILEQLDYFTYLKETGKKYNFYH